MGQAQSIISYPQKNVQPGEGRHEGLVPRNHVPTSEFQRIFPCTDPDVKKWTSMSERSDSFALLEGFSF